MGHETMTGALRAALHEAQRTQEGPIRFEVPSGVAIEEGRAPDGRPRVALRAPDGSLVVEYLPGEGRCRIHAPHVEVEAGDELRLRGRTVRIEADHAVSLRSGSAAVTVDAGRVHLIGDELRAVAKGLSWTAETVRVVADVAETKARRIVERADELETRAQVLVEKTRQSFREAEELAQHKAQRLRLVAEDTFRLLGRRALFKAREDMKLRGDRIYLD